MATFKISRRKEQELSQRMQQLNVSEEDIRERFIRASGPGGQKINKTSSCVSLRHIPTGIIVKCQDERSQSLNRFLARQRLLDEIERLQKELAVKKRQRIEKIRRRKRRRSKRVKEKILATKHKQSEKKRLRVKVKIIPEELT